MSRGQGWKIFGAIFAVYRGKTIAKKPCFFALIVIEYTNLLNLGVFITFMCKEHFIVLN